MEPSFSIPADRIEAGTYLVAAAVTKGNVNVDGINPREIIKGYSKA
jgi:UDP-N-acetylglucosamine 1-carboxyvinyltransferase